MDSPRRTEGFTLFEVMVVVAIIALSAAVFVVGFNVVDSKRLDSEVKKMNDWFNSIGETAVLQSSVLGIRAEENTFRVVAFYDNRWFLMNGLEAFQLSQELQWEVETEERIEFGQSTDEEDENREPFVAFLPSGQALPIGKITVHRSGQESAYLRWDEAAKFEILTTEEES